jgi:hypothetical protein
VVLQCRYLLTQLITIRYNGDRNRPIINTMQMVKVALRTARTVLPPDSLVEMCHSILIYIYDDVYVTILTANDAENKLDTNRRITKEVDALVVGQRSKICCYADEIFGVLADGGSETFMPRTEYGIYLYFDIITMGINLGVSTPINNLLRLVSRRLRDIKFPSIGSDVEKRVAKRHLHLCLYYALRFDDITAFDWEKLDASKITHIFGSRASSSLKCVDLMRIAHRFPSNMRVLTRLLDKLPYSRGTSDIRLVAAVDNIVGAFASLGDFTILNFVTRNIIRKSNERLQEFSSNRGHGMECNSISLIQLHLIGAVLLFACRYINHTLPIDDYALNQDVQRTRSFSGIAGADTIKYITADDVVKEMTLSNPFTSSCQNQKQKFAELRDHQLRLISILYELIDSSSELRFDTVRMILESVNPASTSYVPPLLSSSTSATTASVQVSSILLEILNAILVAAAKSADTRMILYLDSTAKLLHLIPTTRICQLLLIEQLTNLYHTQNRKFSNTIAFVVQNRLYRDMTVSEFNKLPGPSLTTFESFEHQIEVTPISIEGSSSSSSSSSVVLNAATAADKSNEAVGKEHSTQYQYHQTDVRVPKSITNYERVVLVYPETANVWTDKV